jgi:hypothetical protein
MPLNSRSSVAEVEQELTERRIGLQPRVGGKPYAIDRHFAEYAYGDITNLEDALALCARLEAEDGGYCSKASGIRTWLEMPFWSEDLERIRLAIANNRRTCCYTHETGSFAKHPRR